MGEDDGAQRLVKMLDDGSRSQEEVGDGVQPYRIRTNAVSPNDVADKAHLLADLQLLLGQNHAVLPAPLPHLLDAQQELLLGGGCID